MKIIYIANIRLPTEKAHGVQIMKTCEALQAAGHAVTLVVPTRTNPITVDPFDYYRIKTRFDVVRLKTPDLIRLGFLGYVVQTFLFSKRADEYIRKNPSDILLGRDEMVLARLSSLRPVVWETHTGSLNLFARKLLKHGKGIIAITKGLKDFYVFYGADADMVAVVPDAVDLEDFNDPQSQADARRRLGIALDRKVALYIGRVDGWKGTDTLFKADELLPSHIQIVVIGGEPKQIEALRKKYPQVLFLGYRPYAELKDNQAAGDVLVLPNTGKDKTSAEFTSPLKLFTYMASGLPIVASDLPSIREVLNESNAFLVKADDPQALAKGIEAALSAEGRGRAEAARRDVRDYSWQKRAEKIMDFISNPFKSQEMGI